MSSYWNIALFSMGLVGAFCLGSWTNTRLPIGATASAPETEPIPAPSDVASAKAVEPAVHPADAPNFRAIVSRFGPAVVGIGMDDPAPPQARASLPGIPAGDPFLQFFRHLPATGDIPKQGSGFIVSEDGIIFTNAHLVRDAKTRTVTLSDRRRFEASVLGVDPATDIAVLKIAGTELPEVLLGDSDKLAVGDHVLAIGAPYGFEQSAASGIVSAKGRALPGDTDIPFIQTDAAVASTSSGGPLFDATGRVVAVNALIADDSARGGRHVFAIPINLALDVQRQLAAKGTVQRARLGIDLQELSPALAAAFKVEGGHGAIVCAVEPRSPAARAGLEPGDVVLKVGDKLIDDPDQLTSTIDASKPGDTVRLQVWRHSAEMNVAVVLDRAKAIAMKEAQANPADESFDLKVRSLTAGERDSNNVTAGVIIQRADPAAKSSGLRQGDIILSVNGDAIRSPRQLHDIVHHEPRELAVLVARGDARFFVPIKPRRARVD